MKTILFMWVQFYFNKYLFVEMLKAPGNTLCVSYFKICLFNTAFINSHNVIKSTIRKTIELEIMEFDPYIVEP